MPDARASRGGKRGIVAAAAAVLFVVGLLLRLHQLGEADFSGDETDLWRYVIDGVPSPQEPPLPRIVTRLWLEVARYDGNAVVRFPAALAGALTVVATLFLGRALAGLQAGVFAAFVLCVHPFAIAWSQRLRPYGLLGLLTVCSLLAYVEARRRCDLRSLALLSAALTLTTASHALGALIVGAILLDSGLRMAERVLRDRAWLEAIRSEARFVVGGALGLVGLSWILFRPGVTSVATNTGLSRLPGILGDISQILSGGLLAPNWPLGLMITTLTIGAAFLGAGGLWRAEVGERGGRALVLSGVLIVLVVAATLGPKAGFGAREWSRYVSNALPMVAIAVGTALSQIPSSMRARAALAAVGIVVASVPTLGGWSRDASGGRFLSRFAASVKAQEPGLRGILVVGQYWWVERWAINYFRLRQDDLAGYTIFPREPPRRIRAVPKRSTAGFRLAKPFGAEAGPMPSGVYAVLSQNYDACGTLLRMAPKRIRSSRPVPEDGSKASRMTGFCEVEFVSTR